jgi:hypothetical protein
METSANFHNSSATYKSIAIAHGLDGLYVEVGGNRTNEKKKSVTDEEEEMGI